jgi:paraquat-inducible protein A
MRLPRANELGLVLCRTCGMVSPEAIARLGGYCPRCESRITHRITSSTEATVAWLITGIILYIPANLVPVMHTSGIAGEADSTILGGIIEFWRTGSWDIALLIFIASVAVPFTKFIAIGLLVWTAHGRSTWQQHQRTKLYRIVELIGYWSMLDVVVVAITSALVQFRAVGTAVPRPGIAYFCAVVIATMIAAQSFDPRLIWDRGP